MADTNIVAAAGTNGVAAFGGNKFDGHGTQVTQAEVGSVPRIQIQYDAEGSHVAHRFVGVRCCSWLTSLLD